MADRLGLENVSAIAAVFENTPAIEKAVVFGSRAKGSHAQYSDVDIALYGDIDFMEVENVCCRLDELPLIYKFDVAAYNLTKNAALREHIDRVGVVIYERREGNTNMIKIQKL